MAKTTVPPLPGNAASLATGDRLSTKALDWSLQHHLLFGDTDLFPRQFEYSVIEKHWPEVKAHLASLDLRQRVWRTPRRFLVPKDDLVFRAGMQLDPIDSLILAAVTYEIGPLIEERRLPRALEAVFSSRFEPDDEGRLYSQAVSWSMFWTKSLSYAQGGECSHVLVCDIADFYQQVDHEILRQQLELASVPAWSLAALNSMLAVWHGDAGRGLPVGPHAAHILAELSLVPLDNTLSGAYPQFCRFIDDVHIFCRSAAEAQLALYELANTLDGALHLWTSGRKTRVMTSAQFVELASANVKKENLRSEERRVLEIVQEVTGSPYGFASFEDVSSDDREALGPDVLDVVLTEYLSASEPDYPKIRWLLRRLTQISAPGAVEFVVTNLPRLTAAMPDVVAYLLSSHGDFEGDWRSLGNALIRVLEYPLIDRSEYLQLGIFSLFARIADLNHFQALASRFRTAPADVRREIILAAKSAGVAGWLESSAASITGRTSWETRAILYAAELLSPVHRARLREEVGTLSDALLEKILLGPLEGANKARAGAAKADTVPVERVSFQLELWSPPKKIVNVASFCDEVGRRFDITLQPNRENATLIEGETHAFDSFVQDLSAGRLAADAMKAGGTIISLRRADTKEYVYEVMPSVKPKRNKALSVPNKQFEETLASTDVLLVTTTDVEREGVLSYLQPRRKGGQVIEGSSGGVSLRLGRFGRYAAAWVQTEMGSQQRDGSTLTLRDAMDVVKPKAIVMIGIAFGIDRSWQRLGDVLVATSVQQYEHQKINARSVFQRGQELPCGPILAERFRTRGNDWEMSRFASKVQTHHGLMLSGEKLINNREFRDRLIDDFPTAIGGEMEGAGAYAAASRAGREIILVKSICDWADGEKNSLAQPFACATAVSFAHHVLDKPDVLQQLGAKDLLSKR